MRDYTYVETVKEPDLWGGGYSIEEEDPQTITAPTDSAAYIKAYRSFCISEKIYKDMYKRGMSEYLDIPQSFQLFNDKGEDITDIEFVTRAQQEATISAEIAAMDNVMDETGYDEVAQEPMVDSVKIKELLPYFDVEKDEFDPRGTVWCEPKSAPKYINKDGIYLYFGIDRDGEPLPLRIKIQYHADDWLFFSKVQFSIDGNAYEFIPFSTDRDHNGGMIWEWCDEAVSTSDRELLLALSEAKSAKMKFIGRQYYDIKTISSQQVRDIRRALELYTAVGGVY